MKNLTNLDVEILRTLTKTYTPIGRFTRTDRYTGYHIYMNLARSNPEMRNPKAKRKVHKRIAMLMQHGMIVNLSPTKDRYELQITQFGREQLAIVDPPTLEGFFDKDLLEK